MPPASSPALRPLLKWAGGKRQLLPALRAHYPPSFHRYIEPFLGSGAVFFDLYASGRLVGRSVRLADANADLIGCYRAVRDRTEAVIAVLGELEREHRARGAACYYDVRDRRFNPLRAGSQDGDDAPYSPELAAMFIYLNRTGFNGLFRLNRQGAFNVPAGRYTDPRICDPAHIRAVAAALSSHGVTLVCAPFERALIDTRADDFVYCDPPYVPLSATASFAHYTAGGFTLHDHRRLQGALVAAAKRGAAVVLSNSSAPSVDHAYRTSASRDAGLRVYRVPARRAINARGTLRGPIWELIVATTPPRALDGLPLRMARSALRAGHPNQLEAARAGEG